MWVFMSNRIKNVGGGQNSCENIKVTVPDDARKLCFDHNSYRKWKNNGRDEKKA